MNWNYRNQCAVQLNKFKNKKLFTLIYNIYRTIIINLFDITKSSTKDIVSHKNKKICI